MIANELDFRRQFILGEYFIEMNNWKKTKCGNHYLTTHPDLNVVQVGNITLLGEIIDPYNPEYNNNEIIKLLNKKSYTFNDVIHNTYHLGGRWIIIFQINNTTKILTDPCGLRTVFYTDKWCGSQPTLLANTLNLKRNNLDFTRSEFFENAESMWVGDGTIYDEIKRLTPNHFLDFEEYEKKRFWVNLENEESLEDVVTSVSRLLKGTIGSIAERYSPMLGVTAGWDSRTLLAASKDYKKTIHYFVSTGNRLSKKHMDIYIPTRLSKTLNFNLDIIDNMDPIRAGFSQILKQNVMLARNLSKTKIIQYHYDYTPNKIKINGNGSEIVRSYYGTKHPDNITVEYLLNLINYPIESYQFNELKKWIDNIGDHELNTIDLFYWEQRMGNWGAMYPSEQDIAIEEISPFNNRKILMSLLKLEDKYRSSPDYIVYRKIIENLWADALSEPINPIPLRNKINKKISKIIPRELKKKIKKMMK